MTTSTGMLGLPGNTAYATAKGGVIGLARSLAVAGREHGIKVNLIAPGRDHPHGRRRQGPGPAGGATSRRWWPSSPTRTAR